MSHRGRQRFVWLCCLTVAAGLGACAGPEPSGGTVFEEEGVRFTAPAGWNVRASRIVSFGAGRPLVYVSNQPLHDDCTNDPVSADCQLPIDELPAGGVFVWWHTTTCVAAGCALPDGAPIAVGRREAVRAPAEGACTGLAFTSEEQVAVAVTPQRVDTIFICSREPDDAALAGVQALLDSIVWRTP